MKKVKKRVGVLIYKWDVVNKDEYIGRKDIVIKITRGTMQSKIKHMLLHTNTNSFLSYEPYTVVLRY